MNKVGEICDTPNLLNTNHVGRRGRRGSEKSQIW
jgi:hypothetical protein